MISDKTFICPGDIQIRARVTGRFGQPTILFLHGFPEHAGAWDQVLPAFAENYLAIAPDQRGFGSSSKPADVADYRMPKLAGDMVALIEQVSHDRPVTLVAHDWGASVAYALAFAIPDRIERLIVINGVHPWTFQKAILNDHAQRTASAYIQYLRAPQAEARLSANNYAKLFAFLSAESDTSWLTPGLRARYLEAWSTPGALTGMLNWYRASVLVVPRTDAEMASAKMPAWDPSRLRVSMPHLVIWGLDDKALRPVCREGLDEFCDDLTIREVPGADHWIIHQKPDEVIAFIREFMAPSRPRCRGHASP